MSQSAISKWEKNQSSVDATNVAAIRRYLRKPLAEVKAVIAADTEARHQATMPATQVEVAELRTEVASLARAVRNLQSWIEGALGRRPPP